MCESMCVCACTGSSVFLVQNLWLCTQPDGALCIREFFMPEFGPLGVTALRNVSTREEGGHQRGRCGILRLVSRRFFFFLGQSWKYCPIIFKYSKTDNLTIHCGGKIFKKRLS